MKTIVSSIKNWGLLVVLCLLFNLFYTNAQIRITKVDPFTDQVTIHNFGTSTVPIDGYFFCTKRSYGALATITPISGSLNLAGGADVVLVVNTFAGLDNTASDLSIYTTNANFFIAADMVDFMQYGNAFPNLSGRENEAVSRGFWTAGTFILGDPAPWSYTGNGTTENGVNFWVSSSTLSVNDEFLNGALSMYPNPAGSTLNIKKLRNINLNEAIIYDVTGRLVSAIDLSQTISEKAIQLNKISKGIYFIRITDDQGGIVARRFIKE